MTRRCAGLVYHPQEGETRTGLRKSSHRRILLLREGQR